MLVLVKISTIVGVNVDLVKARARVQKSPVRVSPARVNPVRVISQRIPKIVRSQKSTKIRVSTERVNSSRSISARAEIPERVSSTVKSSPERTGP